MAKSNSSGEKALIRINKAIADSGLCSRRKADELIENGSVIINGKKIYELGVKVNPNKDRILVQGKPLPRKSHFVYYAFNKPKNVVTTMDDPLERPTVGDYIKTKERLFPVGRLDWDTEGLLLMTNDGEFAQNVSHPRKEVSKTYLAKLNHPADPKKLERLIKGITIVGGKVSAESIETVKIGKSKKYEWVKISITEGKNRQIRKMFEKIGYDVLKLKRVAIGGLKLGALKIGDYKKLAPSEIERIFRKNPALTKKPLSPTERKKKLISKRSTDSSKMSRKKTKTKKKTSKRTA